MGLQYSQVYRMGVSGIRPRFPHLTNPVTPETYATHLVAPEDLERHHQRVPQEVRVDGGVEDVHAAVIAGGGHQRIVPVKLRRPHSLFVKRNPAEAQTRKYNQTHNTKPCGSFLDARVEGGEVTGMP